MQKGKERKTNEHITTAQKQLMKAKERSLKYVPGTVNLQIVGSGSKGAPASVYLFTDQSRSVQNKRKKSILCFNNSIIQFG